MAERARIQAAINALKSTPAPSNEPPDWVLPSKKTSSATKKGSMSAAGRKSISDATKARWAGKRAAKPEDAALKKKTKATIIAEAIAPPEDAEFKSKMSIAMAKSWAKRKKAAKKKAR